MDHADANYHDSAPQPYEDWTDFNQGKIPPVPLMIN